jgi:predicted ATPase
VRQVLRASSVENRFEARHQEGTAPLLGREEELEVLLRRWQQAKAGEGRVVLITGEPGIGKSRLTQALRERLAAVPHTRLLYHCSPYHQDSALYPVIGQLVRAAGIERDDSADARLDKLETLLAQSSSRPHEDLPIFAALLSIPGGARAPLPSSTPQRLKERTLLAILAQLRTHAAAGTVLLVMEDLHWVDPTTSSSSAGSSSKRRPCICSCC